ncbi:cyclodeaminase/cyclohydrolase family protein [Thermodesulfobacteriota bacterium]
MDFLRKIAGSSPLPAGGAAAAYTACLAIGLINKIVLIEIYRHADDPAIEKNLLTAKKDIERMLNDVEMLIEEDALAYSRFDGSRRSGNTAQMEKDFSATMEVSMNVLEKAAATFEWIKQLHTVAPKQMNSHLLVACELVMSSINGTSHVVRDNLRSIKAAPKRENDLNRLNALQTGCREKYLEIIKLLA